MAHDAERGCSEDEQESLLGDRGPLPPLGPVGRFRWVCGASAGLPTGPIDGASDRPGAEPVVAGLADGLDDPRSAADPADPSGAARSAAARTGPRPAGSAAMEDQAGMPRPGEPVEGTVLASDPSGPEHALTDPGRPVDRSRLVPRPRPGEPDADDQGRHARTSTSTSTSSSTSPGGPEGDDQAQLARTGTSPGGPDGAPERPTEPAGRRTPGCQTDLPGWAGAHRHGAVRPSRRSVRRDRPPRRWC
ncbi:hypothetical protein GCM10022225_31370 [Plantactinospora mayteni]|uniref:Uncharacterized protein n=1 Tax=Plantactinospora mayteni TaxID=566021 RepID=A0ABQ4ELT6_9ACTN|nr:hypothetical protein [Plantactinospora mayteni]GIG95698.1 hypothetical protein Pma05_22710 [Plantactinospora mayteni]